MAALTAASWTVTVTKRTMDANARERKTYGTILLAGTDTYPTGGIPAPDKGKFGMYRELDKLDLVGQSGAATQYLVNYDKSTNKIQLYVSHDTAGVTTLPLDEEDAAGVPGARTWQFIASGF